jgi:predicted N-acyltransferase
MWNVELLSRAELDSCCCWTTQFAGLPKDHRYYEIVEDTLQQGFEFHYLLLRHSDEVKCAVQPCFLVTQNVFDGLQPGIRRLVERMQRTWPGFMRIRTLMIGCAAGEGHLASPTPDTQVKIAHTCATSILECARRLGADLVAFKEFPSSYRLALRPLLDAGFSRIASFPNVSIRLEYRDFEDYCQQRLSRNERSQVRRKLRKAAEYCIRMEVPSDISDRAHEIASLYYQVHERSSFKFERLTEDFFRQISKRMPDKARFFVWKRGERIVGFNLCMIEGSGIYSECIGLDYSIALDSHLYFVIFRDVMNWAIQNGFTRYFSTGLNYEPKYRLRLALEPLDLYVRHVSPAANVALKALLPWLSPVRHEPVLKRFANFHDLK